MTELCGECCLDTLAEDEASVSSTQLRVCPKSDWGLGRRCGSKTPTEGIRPAVTRTELSPELCLLDTEEIKAEAWS